MTLDAVLDRIDTALPEATERLFGLLRIPSISTDPAYDAACRNAADWLVADLARIGIRAEARPVPGQPIVVGHGGTGPRHFLFYGHYDVQPVDPIDLWHRDPFDPRIEATAHGDVIRARGSADDKGQLMTFIEACRAWVDVHGSLPVRLSVLFEGQEESGSPSLVPFLEANAAELTADLALICDTAMFDPQTPAIVTMLRGLVAEEVTIHGPDKDLHSGNFGGLARNPIRVLASILGDLHDDSGRVTLPRFYDGVLDLPDALRDRWAGLGFDSDAFLASVGLSVPAGERDRSPLEQLWARPTCEINGISGGYCGAGFKTVLPAEARAKISFRLVGDQDPEAIIAAFRAFVTDRLPADCTAKFTSHGAAPASRMQIEAPAFEAARVALSAEWPKPAAYIGGGGSIPIAGYFKSILGMESLLIGFSRPDDRKHSPNEKYDLESFHKGIRSWARVLDALSRE